MQHVNRRIESLEPGTLLVLGRLERNHLAREVRPEAGIVSLASVSDGFALVIDGDGRERRIHAASGQEFHEGDIVQPNYGQPRIAWRGDAVGARRQRVLWSDALPIGTPAQALAFAETVLAKGDDGRKDAILLHVEAIHGTDVRCALVVPAGILKGRSPVRFDDGDIDGFGGETVGNAAFWHRTVEVAWSPDEPLPDVGDLVAARRYGLVHEAGLTTAHLTDPVVLGQFPDRASVGGFLPWGVHPTSEAENAARIIGSLSGVADDGSFHYAEFEAMARAEPDEAICLFYQNPADTAGDTSCAGLSSSGIAFFHCDSLSDEFHDVGLEPGVWIMRKAKPWAYQLHEGGWDAGIDGDWEPATQEDLDRHGVTHEEIEEAIADGTEAEAPESGAAVRYLEMAASASAAEKAVPTPLP